MKRKICAILTVIMMLSIISPAALAADSTTTHEEALLFTTVTTAYSEDENGQRTILEQSSSNEVVPISSLSAANGIIPLTVGYAQKTKTGSFEAGKLQLTLSAKFEHEAGYYVTCISKTGNITKNSYNWSVVSSKTSTSQGVAGTYATASYDVTMRTTAGYNRSYNVTITCTSAGVIY